MDLLVDADILACQFAYAYEARRGGGGTRAIVDADMMDPEARDDWLRTDGRWAIAGFDSAVDRMLRETRTDKAILCLPVPRIFGTPYCRRTRQTAEASPGQCCWMC